MIAPFFDLIKDGEKKHCSGYDMLIFCCTFIKIMI